MLQNIPILDTTTGLLNYITLHNNVNRKAAPLNYTMAQCGEVINRLLFSLDVNRIGSCAGGVDGSFIPRWWTVFCTDQFLRGLLAYVFVYMSETARPAAHDG